MALSSTLFPSAASASSATSKATLNQKPFCKTSAEYKELTVRCGGNEAIADSINGREFFAPYQPIPKCGANFSVLTYSQSSYPFALLGQSEDLSVGSFLAKPETKNGVICWRIKTSFLIGNERIDYLDTEEIKESETIAQAIARVNQTKKNLLIPKITELKQKLYALEVNIGVMQRHIDNEVGAAEIHEQGLNFFSKLKAPYKASLDLYLSQLQQNHCLPLLSPRDAIAYALDDANEERISIYHITPAEKKEFRKYLQTFLLSSATDNEVLPLIAERLKSTGLRDYVAIIAKMFAPFADCNEAAANFWLEINALQKSSQSFALGR